MHPARTRVAVIVETSRGHGRQIVAGALAVSRSTLDRLLSAAVGQSATAAIMQVRLARVKTDLVESDLPLKSIARRAGFVSEQHLANLFRSREGLTPGRYRRDMRH